MSGACALHDPSSRPRYAFTLYFLGKSEKWLDQVDDVEHVLHKYKYYRATIAQLKQRLDDMLRTHYTNVSMQDMNNVLIGVYMSPQCICKILDGKHIRVFTDGSTE